MHREREKLISYKPTYVKSIKMVQVNLFAKQKYRQRHREQAYGHQGGRLGGMNWEIGVDMHILLRIK